MVPSSGEVRHAGRRSRLARRLREGTRGVRDALHAVQDPGRPRVQPLHLAVVLVHGQQLPLRRGLLGLLQQDEDARMGRHGLVPLLHAGRDLRVELLWTQREGHVRRGVLELRGHRSVAGRPHAGTDAGPADAGPAAHARTDANPRAGALLGRMGPVRRTGLVWLPVLSGGHLLQGAQPVVPPVREGHGAGAGAVAVAGACRAADTRAPAYAQAPTRTDGFVLLREEYSMGRELRTVCVQELLRPELWRARPLHLRGRWRWFRWWMERGGAVHFGAVLLLRGKRLADIRLSRAGPGEVPLSGLRVHPVLQRRCLEDLLERRSSALLLLLQDARHGQHWCLRETSLLDGLGKHCRVASSWPLQLRRRVQALDLSDG
mmetsp:Transcript_147929/g.412031  ORF Transcript_147929/g.412031 Transcript_147929/m.412031 type:complete len:375 (-) Transcript_147929:400-1524(-)